MKKLPLILLLAFVNLSALRAARESQELADGWKFIQQDAGLAALTNSWEQVTIPHTWNAQDALKGKAGNPQFKDGYFRGPCWYARPLDIPAAWKGRRVFLRFEAASMVSKTYLNGQLLGEHRGAFTAFCYELTQGLKFGGTNELRVQVDNSIQQDVAPLSGDFNKNGGIYRPVHLIVTDTLCITPLDFASPGVYLETKSVDDRKAKVEIRTLLSNGSSTVEKAGVQVEIKDASGKIVADKNEETSIAAGQTAEVRSELEVPNPHRWNGRKDPYLYTATVCVLRGGNPVDEITQPLGFRTVEITQDRGFLLNGQPYPIHGVNRHQDHLGKGWALATADHDEDAKLILEMGATAIRNAHYPQSQYWHDLADHNGLLLWDEVSLVDAIDGSPAFAANAELQLRELIHQLGNHPSIAFWGLFNELDNRHEPPPENLLEHLKSVIRELDTSRVVVGASDHSNKPYNKIPDAICFNPYFGWYNGKATELGAYLATRAAEVGKRVGISEYGAGGNPFQHEEGAPDQLTVKAGDAIHPEEWQDYVHETDWSQIQNNPNVWGSFLWVMFDFSAAWRREGGTVGLNDKGMVTHDRKLRKDVFYFYKANWTEEPMVYITSRRMTPRNEPATEVKIYSNLGEVELWVNGKPLGFQKPDAVRVFRWENVALQPDKNEIQAIGRAPDKMITDQCEWVLTPPPSPAAAGTIIPH